MNTKIYKSVHDLAENLMKAAYKEDIDLFEALYAQLKAICIENENTDKDHPVQWETLADSKDHMSSIAFSMAKFQIELGQAAAAIKSLQNAKVSANKIGDQELKDEISELLESLLEE
jgi:orotate phosphoribosyltransferase-like protein